MASTKANWHLDLPVDESDPFVSVQEVGIPVDLSADPPRLHARLAETLLVEAALYDRGCVCPIKDDPQACCSACRVRHTDAADTLTPLCKVGLEQERILTEISVTKHGS